ncbi:MAG: hypothetical protein JSS77_08090 [Acidobacteria bacterium]|nr:hypothetical protein [Acidobacteriota bacterium]
MAWFENGINRREAACRIAVRSGLPDRRFHKADLGGGVPPTLLYRVLRTLRQNIEEKLTTS